MSRLKHISIFVALSSLVACRAEYPVEDIDQNIPRPNQEPEYDPNEPVNVVPLPYDEQTNYFVTKVQGQGPALGWVNITNPSNNHHAAKRLGSDGFFCANVPLSRNQNNKIYLKPFDRMDREGDEIELNITQSGTPPDLPSSQIQGEPDNVAENMGGFNSTVNVQEGTLDQLIDGDQSTVVTLDNNNIWRDYVEFDLAREADVLSVSVYSTEDCPVEEAVVYYSTQSSVPLTNFGLEGSATSFSYEVQNSEWSVFGTLNNPSGNSDNIVRPSNPGGYRASRMAIEFTSRDCGRFDGLHKIKDISVSAAPLSSDSGQQTNRANTCEGGQ